jgi:type IV secretion system protein TrbL
VSVLDLPGKVVGDVAGHVAGNVIDALADEVSDAVGKAVASVGTLWVKVGTPNLTSTDGGHPSEAVGFLQGSLTWYLAAAAVLSVLIAAAKMAWEGRAQPGKDLLVSLSTLVIVSGAGLTAISLSVAAADSFARWIIDGSLDGTSFGENITALLALSGASGLGAIVVIILGLVAFLASLAQIMLMVVRGGMLVILAGIFPLSASATNTAAGRAWFKKCCAWLVAFILYKPAAAIVYAMAFRLSGSNVFSGDGLVTAATGLVLMVLALLALPALMRFVTPMVGAIASGGGGGGSVAMGAMAAAPSGAMSVPRGASRSGAGMSGPNGAGGSSGPSGAAGVAGARGAPGAGGASRPTGSGAGAGAAAGGGATAGAGGGAAAAGSGAAAAAGPVGAAVAAGATAAKAAKGAAQGATQSQSGDENG